MKEATRAGTGSVGSLLGRSTQRRRALTCGMVGLLLLIGACSSARPAMRPGRNGAVVVASWYGTKYHGRQTANGERYDMYGLTAAHKTLPFGTVLRVTHLGNRRSVVVKVNDRGPFIAGRSIDLSFGAAKSLNMVDEGIAQVKIEQLR